MVTKQFDTKSENKIEQIIAIPVSLLSSSQLVWKIKTIIEAIVTQGGSPNNSPGAEVYK